ncbi:hypothetical protein PPYR_08333 [Photinus pyralis]|uniref:GH18 domain-containing protein n=2 Tax=Photinus pyralis TaxID=7054 RepID=A0A5N4AJ66_PHOPY|nr:chitinase-like protein Idgf4 [Photinus pyralis]KAB0797339.1 hypothetical protein PPYR_08333 [Photinus pyralis]
MIGKVIAAIAFVAIAAAQYNTQNSPYSTSSKIVCYYDTKGHFRSGDAKFEDAFLTEPLQFCTHLVYGFAGVNPTTCKAIPLSEQFDVIQNHYRDVTNLKRRYPGLKVLLSIGGGRDDPEHSEKYLKLLESVDTRLAFVESAEALATSYGFDGIDLAWQFPPNKPKKIHGTWSGIWSKIKHTFVSPSEIDPKHAEHMEQFTALVREMKNALAHKGLLLSMSVLPNVNSTIFHDVPKLAPNLDLVNLWAFDYFTPQRNPKEADYTAPLHELIDRKYDENVNGLVQHWIHKGCPNNKIILGIPTFARTWKMSKDSGLSGVPPISDIKGPGEAGHHTKEEGLLSYEEVCTQLTNPHHNANALRKVGDPTGKFGTYAFKLPDHSGHGGIWVSYEDPSTAENKATYARNKGLGGVAVVDLTLDDFRGKCNGNKYPILRAARMRL